MSGQQHIAWYRTAQQELSGKKLLDLQVICAPHGDQAQLLEVRDQLRTMARGTGD